MDGDFENGDVSSEYGSMNSHSLYQQNGLKPLINLNNRDDIETNYDLNNGGVSIVTGLINSHTISNLTNKVT